MNYSDPRHPVWSFARTLIVLATIGLLLFINANKPDWTELRVWIGACITALLAQTGHEVLKTRAGPKE